MTNEYWVIGRPLNSGTNIAMTLLRCIGVVGCGVVLSSVVNASVLPGPSRAAYIHIERCFDQSDDVAAREAAICRCLDTFKQSGLQTIVPYVSTTSGVAHYPSELVDQHRWGDWDPIAVFVREARARDLQVHLCVPVLACGHAAPAGILLRHPDWALRAEKDGKLLGAISPGHPEARQWIVKWLEEIVGRYDPDGLLLDYMRFPSQASQLELQSAARFAQQNRDVDTSAPGMDIQQFRELLLTELMQLISDQLRRAHPDLHITIYSWGHHVTSGHRVAQNWPTWAKNGYIDEVNVCGYWYPESFPKRWGKNHMEAFRTVITDSQRQLRESGANTKLTFALGVRTSHGQVRFVDDIAGYLNMATELKTDGVTFFTWSYLEAFLSQLESAEVLKSYSAGKVIQYQSRENAFRQENQ